MYKVILVDDETMLLDSLEIILSLNNMEITGKAHDGNEALAVLEKTKCDIALVDLNMKGMGGIELIGHMKKLYPDIRILVLTTFYDDTNITDAISNGADGYLLKDSGKDAILGAVNQIMGGNTLSSLVAANMNANTGKQPDEGAGSGEEKIAKLSPAFGEFTEREKEIAVLIAEGLTNRQIADRLYISEGTVKNYITNILSKENLSHRTALAVYYLTGKK